MPDSVICLACGGITASSDDGAIADDEACTCPPPSVQVQSVTCPSCGGPLRVGARACPFCACTLASCRCPHCTAWNLASAKHCQACGRSMPGDAAENLGPGNLCCPRCEQRLQSRRYSELDVEECDGCGGLFIEPAMMDRIVASRDAPTGLRLALPKRDHQRDLTVRYVRCPVCSKTMNRQAFGRISGVIVDVCKADGVWFDAGELSEVLTFVSRGGLEKARERQFEEIREARRAAQAEQMRASMAGTMTQSGALQSQGLMRRADATIASELIGSLVDLWGRR